MSEVPGGAGGRRRKHDAAPRPKDPYQTLRITRNLMAAGTSLLVVTILCIYRNEGFIAATPFAVAVTLIATLVVVFFVAFRTGLNTRFADPSLTMAQIASAVAVLAFVNFNLLGSRGAFLLVYIMAMLFAVFRLTTRQLLKIVLPVIGAHAIFYLSDAEHLRAIPAPMKVVEWAVLTIVLLWFARLGGYITEMRRKLRTLTTRDELTSAFNRRHLDDSLEREKARADRHGGALCMALMDLDWFKRVNDSYGHLAGDEVLKGFAAIVQDQIRASDLFGRFGGEEFMLILPHTSLVDVGPLMERIRSETGTHRWRVGRGDLVVTVSIGIDEYRRGEDTAALLRRADAALYRAKANGRDQVVFGGAGG